jgi:hypothetical protein
LLIARNAMSNERMRPRRRLEIHLNALDRLWHIYKPPDGSRLKKFKAAYLKVARAAVELGVSQMVFDLWSDRLLFDCDDRDMDEDLVAG